MPKTIIPDTSCLIALDNVGLLHILKSLYNEVLIPEEVKVEFGLSLPSWIKVHNFDKKLPQQKALELVGEG